MEFPQLKSTERAWPGEKPRSPAIPYPAPNRHGVIGDRRTAGLVAADGTLDWLCLPDYDANIVFGALLDWRKGGYWRLGPSTRIQGRQSYVTDSMVLETEWQLGSGTLILRDAMLWPETQRPPEQQDVRGVVRCLRCAAGKVQCRFDLEAAADFGPPRESFTQYTSGYSLNLAELGLRVWCSRPLDATGAALQAQFELTEGQELWTVLELGAAGHGWSVDSAKNAMAQAEQYWCNWLRQFELPGCVEPGVRRAALTVHLLSYATEGCAVAAPTTSLPERIGGGWNADYRLSWVRDTSLALGILAKLGDWEETNRYLQWLVKRQSRFGYPLQVLYQIHGGKRPAQKKLDHVSGYRGSLPARVGNHAYKQRQFGSLGFLADCIWTYVQEGGAWHPEYWQLIRRCADYIGKHWHEPDNGVWELAEPRHFVHSKVMCWVMLDRAIKIAGRVNSAFDREAWQTAREAIHQEVMDRGWSERLGAFRQHYDGENLDAAELLISLMDFLPGNHPRVLATIDQIAQALTIDGLVYRFNPLETDVAGDLPLGQFEGAFLPCTFWLAAACARAGRLEQAQAILARVENLAGPIGLLAEAADPRTGNFLGNTPLLFSHAEYVRAKLELALAQKKGQPFDQAA